MRPGGFEDVGTPRPERSPTPGHVDVGGVEAGVLREVAETTGDVFHAGLGLCPHRRHPAGLVPPGAVAAPRPTLSRARTVKEAPSTTRLPRLHLHAHSPADLQHPAIVGCGADREKFNPGVGNGRRRRPVAATLFRFVAPQEDPDAPSIPTSRPPPPARNRRPCHHRSDGLIANHVAVGRRDDDHLLINTEVPRAGRFKAMTKTEVTVTVRGQREPTRPPLRRR